MKSQYFYQDPKAPAPTLPMSVGCVAVLWHQGQVLFEERADGSGLAFIGGRLEPDEDILGCVTREVWEETGLAGLAWEFFGVFSDPTRIIQYADCSARRILTLVFTANVEDVSGLRVSEESLSLRFLAPDELDPRRLVATHRPILASLRRSARPVVE